MIRHRVISRPLMRKLITAKHDRCLGYEMAEFGKRGIINDDGYSGKDLNRPGIQSILKDIHEKSPSTE